MLNPIYTLLKQRLATITELKEIAWYMRQPEQGEASKIIITPACYIEILPIATTSEKHKAISALVNFRLHLVSTMLKTDDSRLSDSAATDHLALVDTIYSKIQQFQALYSTLPGNEAVADTDADYMVINSTQRTGINPDHRWTNKLVTVQEFKTLVRWREQIPPTQDVDITPAIGVAFNIPINNPGYGQGFNEGFA